MQTLPSLRTHRIVVPCQVGAPSCTADVLEKQARCVAAGAPAKRMRETLGLKKFCVILCIILDMRRSIDAKELDSLLLGNTEGNSMYRTIVFYSL